MADLPVLVVQARFIRYPKDHPLAAVGDAEPLPFSRRLAANRRVMNVGEVGFEAPEESSRRAVSSLRNLRDDQADRALLFQTTAHTHQLLAAAADDEIGPLRAALPSAIGGGEWGVD